MPLRLRKEVQKLPRHSRLAWTIDREHKGEPIDVPLNIEVNFRIF